MPEQLSTTLGPPLTPGTQHLALTHSGPPRQGPLALSFPGQGRAGSLLTANLGAGPTSAIGH